MAYISIATTEIAVDKPLTNELMTKIKDNEDYLYGELGALTARLINPSFDVDSDADGIPDSWTVTLYSGGAASLTTAVPSHGDKCMKFVHPGGAANGAGNILSDFIPISTMQDWQLSYDLRSSVAMRNAAQVHYYKVDQTSIDTTQVRFETGVSPSTSTAGFVRFAHIVSPSASARYAKILLIAGTTTANVAGDAYYDNVAFDSIEPYAPGTRFVVEAGYISMGGSSQTIISYKVPRRGELICQMEMESDNPANWKAATMSLYRNGSLLYSLPLGGGLGTVSTNGTFAFQVARGDSIAVYGNMDSSQNSTYDCNAKILCDNVFYSEVGS